MIKLLLSLSILFCCCKLIQRDSKTKKIVTARYFHSKGSFCTSSIILNSDSTYCMEAGCENHSNVNLGTWQQVGDSLFFTQIDPKKTNFIAKYQEKGVKKDSIVFRVTDKLGEPISYCALISYPYNARFVFTKGSEFYLKDINRWHNQFQWDNETRRLYHTNMAKEYRNGKYKISCKDIELFEFGSVSLMSNQKLMLKNEDIKGDTVDIQFNFNREAIGRSDLKWYNWRDSRKYHLKDSVLSNKTDTLFEIKQRFNRLRFYFE